MIIGHGVLVSAYGYPKYIRHLSFAFVNLDFPILAPNQSTGDCKGDFVNGTRVMVGAFHDASNVFLQNVNVGNGAWHDDFPLGERSGKAPKPCGYYTPTFPSRSLSRSRILSNFTAPLLGEQRLRRGQPSRAIVVGPRPIRRLLFRCYA